MRQYLLAVSIAALVGCTKDSTGVCANAPVQPIVLRAEDARTSESLDSRAALTVIELQAPFDTIKGPLSNSPPSLPLAKISDMTGRFKLLVDVPGYARWEQTVTVDAEGPCRLPHTINVTARLNPL
jgi:hypothetical protein